MSALPGPDAWLEPFPPPPEGALTALPAEPLRQLVGMYIAQNGETVPAVARAIGMDEDYLLNVMSGAVRDVDAYRVRAMAQRLDLAPEDIWGGELGAAIGWVYGDLSPADLQLAPPAPPEPTYPTLSYPPPTLEPPDLEL